MSAPHYARSTLPLFWIDVSTRFIGLLLLALVTGLAVGCAPSGASVQDASGFLPGLVDGFLILFNFLGGNFGDAGYLNDIQAGTSYDAGFISGATAFGAVATLLSLP